MTRIKICCIQNVEEALMAVRYGASALGLVSAMPSGPGPIPEDRIASIAATVPPGVSTFLLTSLQDADSIIRQQRRLRTSTLQLVDEVSIEALKELRTGLPGIKLVQVIHVRNEESVKEAMTVGPHVDGILLDSGRPIFFHQKRMGQGGRTYRVVKLRTMRQDAEADGQAHWAEAGDPRTTRVGRLLRRTHLDEFPQFWNVLRGDMSLVGPRPERPELVAELEKKIPFYRARLLVKPGVTGWAQVNYGKGASVEGSAEKLEFDLYYIKHRSLWMDLWILLRTVGSVFGFRGV